jgi:acetyl-CoA acetyltransferase
MQRHPSSTGAPSTTSSTAAPTRPARTTATSPAWRLLLAGLPQAVPGATINRLCGSGMDAVGSAARAIRAGDTELMIAGGVESMTRAPFVMGKADAAFSRNARFSTPPSAGASSTR